LTDVAVIGGGPAGLALAGLVARRGLRVVVLDRERGSVPAVGETFGGEIHALLGQLGVAVPEPVVRFTRVRSAWGSPELIERDSVTHPLGDGIHVDRGRFDAALADWAAGCGATVERVRGGRSRPAAHYVVDATGRGAQASGALGRRWIAFDRAIARIARVRPARDEPGLLVEATRDGWWYSAPQPDGTCVVVQVTDHDLGKPRLADAPHTAERIGKVDAFAVVRADSGCAVPSSGQAWCAIGDAALATDPLAGNGVARALRSAIAAAAAIANDGPPAAPEVAAYLRRRAAYYALEARWPEAMFWQRRRPIDRPITLAPEAVIRATGDARPETVAPAEAYLPPRAITALLAWLAAPAHAHVAMTRLRELAPPVGDRSALLGLQLLVERGAVTAS
jgi:flavin-dependent dehydrogenase